MIAHCLYITQTEDKGKGVFTTEPIAKNSVIEIAPVLVMSAAERQLLDQTLLHDYIFEWGMDSQQCCVALGWVSVYNHSFTSNCEYEMDYTTQSMQIRTVRDIAAGEELLVNYGGSWDAKPSVWFEPR
ncbi:SET domain-containing protein-lysine N-methyltransferase [Niabella terrae]